MTIIQGRYSVRVEGVSLQFWLIFRPLPENARTTLDVILLFVYIASRVISFLYVLRSPANKESVPLFVAISD